VIGWDVCDWTNIRLQKTREDGGRLIIETPV
jgi:hypothetical protein